MTNEHQSAFALEQQQLKTIAAEIHRQHDWLHSIPRYIGDDITELSLEDARERNRRNLKISMEEPYFGRLDFQEDGKENSTPLYIGKVGLSDPQSGQLLIIDWRAPVASMFYSFTGGEEMAFYVSPEGLIEGWVHLKRNLVIRDRELQRVVDAYIKGSDNIGLADEFLLYRLGENKDNRLRDIVSTIQSEQNDIIRAPRQTALIIQGVAGSGKTTVALHRLAYLIYEYRENMLAEKMIIFAPNSMFLDYISNVLPELGVGDIQQTTFSEWSLEKLDHDVKLMDSSGELEKWFEPGPGRTDRELAPGRYKGSLEFQRNISKFLEIYDRTAVPKKHFEAWDGKKLAYKTIHEWYHIEYKHYPPAKRRERVIARIKRWIDTESKKVLGEKQQKELKKKGGQRVRSYAKAWTEPNPLTLYAKFLGESQLTPPEIVKATLPYLKKKHVREEDLAPLVFIHLWSKGINSDDRFHHVVLDEAQDFSPFQVSLLKSLSQRNSFTILGDLSQGIHDYKGIASWEEFSTIFGTEDVKYFELERSYRSTTEIIEFANGVLSAGYEPIVLARPVFRSGESVRVQKVSKESRIEYIEEAIKAFQEQKASTIAIVGRTEGDCRKIFAELKDRGVPVSIIDSSQRDYKGGISVIPVYLTKGLEFDAVLIVDVDSENYQKNEGDAKLLYVGCTRALHHLWMSYTGECSPLVLGTDN